MIIQHKRDTWQARAAARALYHRHSFLLIPVLPFPFYFHVNLSSPPLLISHTLSRTYLLHSSSTFVPRSFLFPRNPPPQLFKLRPVAGTTTVLFLLINSPAILRVPRQSRRRLAVFGRIQPCSSASSVVLARYNPVSCI